MKKQLLIIIITFICSTGFSRMYKVRRGDTAYGICRKFGISFSTLKSLNPGKNLNYIKYGQYLNIKKKNTKRAEFNNNKPVIYNYMTTKFSFISPIQSIRKRYRNVIRKKSSQFSLYYTVRNGKIVSAYKGIVSYAGRLNFLGKVVFIKHFDNIYTVYKIYNAKLLIEPGQRVKKGSIIAVNANKRKKLRLKFHLLKGIRPINPMRFIR